MLLTIGHSSSVFLSAFSVGMGYRDVLLIEKSCVRVLLGSMAVPPGARYWEASLNVLSYRPPKLNMEGASRKFF